ncbi:MAG: hypothetical protein JSV79_06945, partial [Armatimonadota bacterium]
HMARREEYEGAARGVAAYLAERQRPEGGFPGPDNYGVACALWLWSHFGVAFVGQVDRAWDRLKREPPTTHGEFNTYALLHCRERLGAGPVDALVRRIRFGSRHSANWMLLRAVCRALPGPMRSCLRSSLEARAALLRYARGGFIADRPGVRSFSYHAFCGALLADLWEHRGARWAGDGAVRAARAMAHHILPNGDGLYLGRGQHQIFGYGSLLHLLQAAHQLTGEQDFAQLADSVFCRLMSFQRRDGSFPLVLREGEPAEPWAPDPSLPGWYSYNRYADYLPLLACFLLKAARAELRPVGTVGPARPYPALRCWRTPRYVAVVSAPGGPSTNDLAFPYVCCEGESLFPCYGAEGEPAEPEVLPLPYGVLPSGECYGFRDRLQYRLTEKGLAGSSRLVRHVRDFEFNRDGFLCRDQLAFRRRSAFSPFVPANFLFRTLRHLPGGGFETWHRGARASLEMKPEGAIHPAAGVSASGPLVALRHVMGRLEARAGDTISTELRVRFP